MMKKILAALLLIPALAFATSYFVCKLTANTYYVSPSGSDSNACTYAAPCLTINTVINKMNAGDTLYLRGGTYSQLVLVPNTINGTSLLPVTISGFSTETANIDGTSVSMSAMPDYSAAVDIGGSYVVMKNLTVQYWNLSNPGGASTYHSGRGVFINNSQGAHGVTNVTIDNVTVHDVFSLGINSQGDNTTIKNSTVYGTGINNCRFHTVSSCGYSATSSGCTNAASVFTSGTGGCGSNQFAGAGWPPAVAIYAPEGHSTWIVSGGLITNNTVHDNWGEGINTFDTNGVTIKSNTIYNNFSENLYASNAVNMIMSSNLVYNSGTYQGSAGTGGDTYWASDSPVYLSFPGFSIDDECNDSSVVCTYPAYNLSENETVIDNLFFNVPNCIECFTQVTNPCSVSGVPYANNGGACSSGSPYTPTTGAYLSGLQNSLVANNTAIVTSDLPNWAQAKGFYSGGAHPSNKPYAWQTGYQGLSPAIWNCNSLIEDNLIVLPSYNSTVGSLLAGSTTTNNNTAACPAGVTITANYNWWGSTLAAIPNCCQGGNDVDGGFNNAQTNAGGATTAGNLNALSYFKLNGTSTAINAGISISAASSPSGVGVMSDYFGNPMNTPPNMGGYQ